MEQTVQDSVLQVPRKYPAGVVRAFMLTLTAEHGWQATLHTYTCMHTGKLAVMSCCPLCSVVIPNQIPSAAPLPLFP